MNQTSTAVFLIFISLAGILIGNSAYLVDQTEQAVITQFGEPVGDPILTPGLHWKTPFLQVAHQFDNRVLEWDGYPSEIPTRDKKFIWVDVTGRWRIQNALKFLQTIRTEREAQSRLDDIMDGSTRNFVTKHDLVDVVRSSNRILEIKAEAEELMGEANYEKIDIGRDTITRQILEDARAKAAQLGIELIDLRIKRINYIDKVLPTVFERMISERKRAAEQLRSEGQAKSAEIAGEKEKEYKRITSEAYRDAQKIRGAADAEATKIYGEAYSRDPQFYAFIATLEKYPEALKDGRVVLTTESDFLKYLKKAE